MVWSWFRVVGIVAAGLPSQCRHRRDGGVAVVATLVRPGCYSYNFGELLTVLMLSYCFDFIHWSLPCRSQLVLYHRTLTSLVSSFFQYVSSCFCQLLNKSQVNLAVANLSLHMN
jgi:hypothetical protein